MMPMISLCLLVALPALAQQQPPQPGRPPQVPPGVKVTRDLEYGKVEGRKLLLDLYLPEKATGPLPVIVGIHGGGWAAGSKEGAQGVRQAGRGYAVACIGYRLSGEAIFPAQIEDCKAAVRWLRDNAGMYGLDPDRIGATGHSAGGHLASLLGTTGNIKEFDQGEHRDQSAASRRSVPCRGRPTYSRWTPTPFPTLHSSTTTRNPQSRD